MADLDQVSSQIGELIAMTRSTQNQVATLFSKQDKLNEEVIEQRGAIKLLGQQFLEHKTAFAEHRAEDSGVHNAVNEIKEDFEATKNKGKGFAIALGLLGGGGGLAGFTAAWRAFMGGGS